MRDIHHWPGKGSLSSLASTRDGYTLYHYMQMQWILMESRGDGSREPTPGLVGFFLSYCSLAHALFPSFYQDTMIQSESIDVRKIYTMPASRRQYVKVTKYAAQSGGEQDSWLNEHEETVLSRCEHLVSL